MSFFDSVATLADTVPSIERKTISLALMCMLSLS